MRHSRTKSILILLAMFSLAIIATACSTGKGSGEEGDFVLNLYTESGEITGDSVVFDELVANDDRPILLNFWASNCPPCRAEMPAFELAWQEYGDQVLIIGVDVGPYVGLGSFEGGKKLVNDLGITYPTGSTTNRSVVTDWQLSSMPSTYLLRSDGRVHDIVIGGIPSSRISQKLLELIAVEAS
jgi:thiol-disulfide isomerase/thioredoxin